MSRYLRLYLRRRATPARAKRASPRSLSIITASVLWALRSCANEAAQHSSAMHAICTGPSTGSGADLPPLPTAPAHRVACDPEARREASRSVCSDFRKSIRFHTEMLICRCNASDAMLGRCPRATVGAPDDHIFGQTIQLALDHIDSTPVAHSCAKETPQICTGGLW